MAQEQLSVSIEGGTVRGTAEGDLVSFKGIPFVYADRTMIEPTRHLAAVMAGAAQPAYYYRFSYVDEAYRGQLPGAIHGLEIPYAYDMPVGFDGTEFVLLERKGSGRSAAIGPTSSGPVTRTAPACRTGRATTRPRATCWTSPLLV
jgi:carboxylesterase type B